MAIDLAAHKDKKTLNSKLPSKEFIKKYKWWLVAGLAIGLVAFLFFKNKSGSSGNATTAAQGTTASGIDPNTGIPYSTELANAQNAGAYSSGGSGGGSSGSSTDTSTTPTTPTPTTTTPTTTTPATPTPATPGNPPLQTLPLKFKLSVPAVTPPPATPATVNPLTAMPLRKKIGYPYQAVSR